MSCRSLSPLAVALGVSFAFARAASAQPANLGHKVLGGLGMQAGSQDDPGLYVENAVLWYGAAVVRDQSGQPLPLEGVNLDLFEDELAASAIWQLGRQGPYLGTAMAVPFSGVRLNVDRPEASLDDWGLGELYVEPVKLGWRVPHVDVVMSYAFYVPVRRTEPGGVGSLANPQWSHELALGGTLFPASRRDLYISALASYELNQRKLRVDITRGDTVQLQGGAGAHLWKVVDCGIAGYALWQVRDDRGSALPFALRGARDRVYGVGPELLVTVPRIHAVIDVRYEHELGARARPEGQIVVATVAWRAFSFERPAR